MLHIRTKVLLMLLVLIIPSLAAAQSTVTIDLMAKNLTFNMSTITVPAGANVVVNFDNQDNGVSHNFAVYTNSSASTVIFKGNNITGPKMTTYTFTAPTTPGTYFFRCDTHPTTMTGQFIVSSVGAVSPAPAIASANVSVTGPTNVTNVVNVTNVTVKNTTNVTQPAPYGAPGFEGIFVITSLLAVAYLVLGRKQ